VQPDAVEPRPAAPVTPAPPVVERPAAGERPVPRPPSPPVRAQRRDPDRGDRVERGLRGLVGSGPSQVGVSGAMRARDASRPTEEDLAAAERELVIVRRNYVPPDQLAGVPEVHHPPRPGPHAGGSAPADS
jgi:hypothetical protein